MKGPGGGFEQSYSEPRRSWDDTTSTTWIRQLAEDHMYPLALEGIDQAVSYLGEWGLPPRKKAFPAGAVALSGILNILQPTWLCLPFAG